MAETEATAPTEQPVLEEKKLKYLDFVQLVTIYVVVCCSTIYEYAKENSGPLRAGVQTVEGAVKAVVGPVFEKFQDVPFQLLYFADRKVDESIIELEYHVPVLLKQVWTAARELVFEVQRAGFVDITKTAYIKYEPVAEQYAVTAWRSLNGVPLFAQLAQIMVPTAAYWAERYNQAVAYTAERGYTVSYYMPLVPIERISKTFGADENVAADVSANGGE
ncbi:hypothetical protein ABFS82_14G130600 [Erythranthe guttata]|uniref:Stress-related protein n=1 Tax=Erythranthe guttata TaxID=4155 RepID=A0A022RTF0_ERYGU|nr:PREDICTED: stress-related protein-like [Erythranthe guttata]EYU42215.1 hypothetical protein MIMGU_mgv1a013510mg [Erythranthe guttata]|eukprot:XP_012831511.1 PREDICTED: stress-related protein-like [Erythranthe guttata]